MSKTLFEKIWDSHVVAQEPGSPAVLYIDLHLVHEVTSPQAFTGLRERGLRVRRPDKTVATVDHSIPTHDRVAADLATRRRPSRSRSWRPTAASSASRSTTAAAASRASSTSSGRSRG